MLLCMILFPMLIYSMLLIFLNNKNIFSKEKMSPFECGFEPFLKNRIPFSLRFFKIAVIFIIFDIEIILILPIPFLMNNMSLYTSLTFIILMMIILLGLFIEWQQGSLSWIK
uniref:NADH-ubiquinone oxidoreductase chain 3 n=1 Tax=Macrocheles nataliae TaxID=2058476 RepID=A0A6B9WH33_9ACAR|nr:NADH dehydrogenase subunit 3 [Macrocheles nataliae]